MKKIKVFYMDSCPYCKTLMGGLDELGYEYEKIDVDSPEGEKDFLNLYEFTKCENIPTVIVGKNVLLPDITFETIEQGVSIIKKLYTEGN